MTIRASSPLPIDEAFIFYQFFHDGYDIPACGRQARTMKIVLNCFDAMRYLSSEATILGRKDPLCAMRFSKDEKTR